MSYWVYLQDNRETVTVPSHSTGGTRPWKDIDIAEVNVTYNYSWFFNLYLGSVEQVEGIRWLHGKEASTTIYALEHAVNHLGTVPYKDYWAPTPGNAGYILDVLLGWARIHPDAIWRVS